MGTEMAPLLIDSLVTASSTFCDFFSFTCIKLLTVISRGLILRIQIRGTYTPQTSLSQSVHGPFGGERNQAGFKAKKPTRSLSSAPHWERGSCMMAGLIYSARGQSICLLRRFYPVARFHTTGRWMHQRVQHQKMVAHQN